MKPSLIENIEPKEGLKDIFVDASILANFNCFRYYYRKAILNKVLPSRGNYKQAFGTAVHKFLQSFYELKDFHVCLKQATDYYDRFVDLVPVEDKFEFRTMRNLQATCFGYAQLHKRTKQEDGSFKLQDDDFLPLITSTGKPLLECKFAIPIWQNTKYRLILAGTIDMGCSYGGHNVVLVDHKTTSANRHEEFISRFELSIQTMLYSKVFKDLNGLDSYPPIVINCLFLKKPTIKADKEGLFDGCTYTMSPIMTYEREQMAEFEKYLNRAISNIIFHLEKDCADAEDDFNYAACSKAFGVCEYFNVCKLEKKFHQASLENLYVEDHYNPLHFQD